jgi:hypothetical protein
MYRIVLEDLALNDFEEELSLVMQHEFPFLFTRIELPPPKKKQFMA